MDKIQLLVEDCHADRSPAQKAGDFGAFYKSR